MRSSGNEGEEDGEDEEGGISTYLKSKNPCFWNHRISDLPEVFVSAKEEPDLPICPAMDGLLSVHKRIVDVDSDSANGPSGAGGIVCTRLLVAANDFSWL